MTEERFELDLWHLAAAISATASTFTAVALAGTAGNVPSAAFAGLAMLTMISGLFSAIENAVNWIQWTVLRDRECRQLDRTAPMTATPVDELHALITDYEGEGACSCAESALLRWILRRAQAGGADDMGLALTALRRMEAIDAGTPIANDAEALPLMRDTDESERITQGLRPWEVHR